jgi:Dipeptidase
MCTIGNSFQSENNFSGNCIFKQCDLVDSTAFLPPEVKTDPITKIRYVAMTRKKADGSTPAWAGINEYGVSFVAADSYMDKDTVHSVSDKIYNGMTVFDMYLQTITQCTSALEASKLACAFYEKHFKEPDIFMVADANSSYFIEAYNGNTSCIKRKKGFFASTNHFRMLYKGVPYNQNHSTYLRLNRAEQILQTNPMVSGIGDLLRDEYYGETVWSVCRHSYNSGVSAEARYYTQAAVIFYVSSQSAFPRITCEYVINGNASEAGKGYRWTPFENTAPEKVEYIGAKAF